MKKTSIIVKEKSMYDIDILIGNTAYIKSVTGKTGLLNIKTNAIIGDMDYYHTIYDTNGKFYIQTLEIEKGTRENNWHSKKNIRIYDALNEKMIADGFEIVESYRDYFEVASLRSSIDGKIHLFDKYACRKPTNIFDMALDDVKMLYKAYNDTYFVVTMNGKKGLYHNNCYNEIPSLITQIEFDEIEKLPNIIVYTKNNEKYFVCDGKDGKTSAKFESITVDEQNKNIVYCKKENKTHIYNTESQELLLISETDEVKYLSKYGDSYNDHHGEFIFLIKQNEKLGLVSSKINNEIKKSNNGEAIVTELLTPDYDEIEQHYNRFYLKQNDKMGLFIGDSNHNQLIEPIYDNIDYLGEDYFALYIGEYCDIGRMTPYTPFTTSVTNCQIEKNIRFGLIYKKDGKYGLILTDRDNKNTIIPNNFESISCVLEYYFILEKDSKKGFMHHGKMVIPMDYDEIQIGGSYGKYSSMKDAKVLYFSLKKGNKFELAKMHNYQYVTTNVEFVSNHTFDSIDFFRDIMVFKDQNYTYIYDYEEKLVKTFPAQTSVIPFAKPCSKWDEEHNHRDYFYAIDGVYFYYKDGKFEKVLVEENDCYVTTYEIGNETFELRTFNKTEHDAFCQTIESKEDSEAEKTLIEIAKNGNNKYPTLVLKRVNNNQ